MHFVYTIARSDGLVKIGHSSNPDSRLTNLQTGSPEKFTLLSSIGYATLEKARIVEAFWHVALAELRVRNEWFSAEAAKSSCKRINSKKAFQWLSYNGHIRYPRTRKAWHPVTGRFVEIQVEKFPACGWKLKRIGTCEAT